MHTYSTDNDFKPKILAGIGVLAFIFATFINNALHSAIEQFDYIPLEISFLVTIGIIFTGLYWVFNQHIWSYPNIPSSLVAVPDLSGEWEGNIKTNFDGDIPEEFIQESDPGRDEFTTIEARLKITQTWRHISVHFETERSESYSLAASFISNDTMHPRFYYIFRNEGPSPEERDEDEGMYDGTAQLKLKKQGKQEILKGFYYTGPSRENNVGVVSFQRVE